MEESNHLKSTRWGFIGAGQMAGALIKGMIASKVARPDQIWASDPLATGRDALQKATGIHVTGSNAEVIERSNVIVLAVKPQMMGKVLEEMRSHVNDDHLFISIAAGISLQRIGDHLGTPSHGRARRLVRVMPNTPCLVGAGASGYTMGPGATSSDEGLVKACLEAVGIAFRVPESLLDGVTGLSGSGPAFVYAVIEALSDGGVRVGLPRDIATPLAAQTVLGAARMVLETRQHTGALKDQVTSPGGTTIAGIHALERGNLRASLMNAVEAAAARSKEMSG